MERSDGSGKEGIEMERSRENPGRPERMFDGTREGEHQSGSRFAYESLCSPRKIDLKNSWLRKSCEKN